MTTIINQKPVKPLLDLGFSEIEALVYTFLVSSEPSTGYRISHAIGKPTANTYKAIAALEQRGAVLIDDGDNRLVRAVPPDELLAGLERRALQQREAARTALATLAQDDGDDRVYTLRDRDQVLERARVMLARAQSIVLGDVFPAPLAALADDLAAAAARGVRVVLKSYADAKIGGVEVVVATDGDRALAAWPGQQLSLVVDADEHLLAMFDFELAHVRQAVWSRSAFLSCLHHNQVAMELLVTADSRPRGTLADISLIASNPPGLSRLRRAADAPTKEGDPT
jgi:HTH-type transcriptional regulator, sugar sensing transcriptional regulator